MMAAKAPTIMSAFKAGNDNTKNYASHFCPFIKKAKFFFQNYFPQFCLCLWPEKIHMGTLTPKEIGKK